LIPGGNQVEHNNKKPDTKEGKIGMLENSRKDKEPH